MSDEKGGRRGPSRAIVLEGCKGGLIAGNVIEGFDIAISGKNNEDIDVIDNDIREKQSPETEAMMRRRSFRVVKSIGAIGIAVASGGILHLLGWA